MLARHFEQYTFPKKLQSLPFVEKIILFGSRARGDNTQTSDIDLAISCPRATRNEWGCLLDIIDNADTLLKIDCLRFDALNSTSLLKQNIDKEGIILYVKDHNSNR